VQQESKLPDWDRINALEFELGLPVTDPPEYWTQREAGTHTVWMGCPPMSHEIPNERPKSVAPRTTSAVRTLYEQGKHTRDIITGI
jgi:hypothetical protein